MRTSEEGSGTTHMPFHVNNVDGSVAANMLFGITKSIIYHPEIH